MPGMLGRDTRSRRFAMPFIIALAAVGCGGSNGIGAGNGPARGSRLAHDSGHAANGIAHNYSHNAAAHGDAFEHAALARETLESAAGVAKAGADMAQAANAFTAALAPEQREKTMFEMKDEERLNWHFVPRERKGLPFKEMSAPQRELAHALFKTGMSPRGYATATAIIDLENVLREIEKAAHRDPERYFFSIFGTPEASGTWGWRVEGHHLSLNFSIVQGRIIASAPSFMGANPAKVLDGPKKGLRVLDKEEDLGRALVRSLSDEQKKRAIFAKEAPAEIITGNQRKAQIGEPVGLGFSEMTAPQKEMLLGLVRHYANRFRPEVAEHDLARIEAAGHDTIRFAWAGGTEPGTAHYYRIHGKTFLVEYDDIQNNANHIHTVWRDLERDFADDLLRDHYKNHPHGGKN